MTPEIPLNPMTKEQIDRYLEILHRKNELSAKWLELELSKRNGKLGPFAPPVQRPNGKPDLTPDQLALLYTEDGGETYASIRYLETEWPDINKALKAAGYRWVSAGKNSYWTRREKKG